MDDLLNEFLTETAEAMETLDNEVVRLEQDPNDAEIIGNIFRLVHTIKGTCGFLGLPRLESLSHAAENVMSRFRDGDLEVAPDRISLVLETLDQIKYLLNELEANEAEPDGDDADLKARLNHLAEKGEMLGGDAAPAATAPEPEPQPEPEPPAPEPEAPAAEGPADGEEPEAEDNDELQAIFDATPYTGPGADEMAARVAELKGGGTSESTQGDAPEHDKPVQASVPVPAAEAAKPADGDAKPREGAKEGGGVTQTIRVNVDLLENLMTMVSELVLTRNQLLQILRMQKDSDFNSPLQRLSHVTSELQEGVMKTRMQPIGNAWAKLPRIVRDLSIELDKKINLQMIGADTELDRQVLELIKDPLTHMVRNSADHGVEVPADRLAAGKPETGTITLNAFHEGGHIVIEISDDGRGLSMQRIREKVINNGIAAEADLDSMSEYQIQQFIFSAGFSTAAKITSVSGRGVGMDVVKNNIDKIGGTVELKSIEGKGTTFLIKIPLTLAIVSALVIECGDERFAVPQISVVELVRASENSEHKIEEIHGTPVLRLRNRLLPLVSLRQLLGMSTEDEDYNDTFIIVSQVGTYSFGIIVDRVFDTEEIVVKPVAPVLRSVSIFSGNTILGDGSVIMILDPNGIAQQTGEINISDHAAAEAGLMRDTDDEDRIALLLFRTSDDTPKAVPLGLVARLEEIDLDKTEYSDGRAMVQYRGHLMPLLPIDPKEVLPREGKKPVLVFADRDRSMGVVVEEILDIVEERLSVELGSERDGMVGSAIVSGQATDVIDTGYYLTLAFSDWFGAATESTLTSAMDKRRVLLVDDSAFFRNLLTPLLSVSGYSVVAVDSALQAIEMCEGGEEFDAIVADIEMPEMNGFELCETLRKGSRWADVPIIAMTSHTTNADIERGRSVGFTDYLAKHDRDALLHSLEETIGGKL